MNFRSNSSGMRIARVGRYAADLAGAERLREQNRAAKLQQLQMEYQQDQQLEQQRAGNRGMEREQSQQDALARIRETQRLIDERGTKVAEDKKREAKDTERKKLFATHGLEPNIEPGSVGRYQHRGYDYSAEYVGDDEEGLPKFRIEARVIKGDKQVQSPKPKEPPKPKYTESEFHAKADGEIASLQRSLNNYTTLDYDKALPVINAVVSKLNAIAEDAGVDDKVIKPKLDIINEYLSKKFTTAAGLELSTMKKSK